MALEQRGVTERVPELQEAAKKLKAGEITGEDYAKLVQQYKPVKPYTEVPQPITADLATAALTSDKAPRFGQASATLKQGDPVGLRLDIPAYRDHGAWVVSVHAQQPGFAAGKSIGYESTASVTNATLGMSEPAALSIASGKPKGTIATIKGDWNPMTPEQAKAMADQAMTNPEWRQVGMDPERHSYFYDRETMQPITAADEVIQVGPLVLAKNPKYGKASEFLYQTEQAAQGQVKGFAAFAEDGRRVIGFLNSPDFSTAVEEISHVGRRQLFDKDMPQAARMGISNEDIDAVAKWSGATEQDGRWTWDVAAEEKFAKGFQKYLRDGEAPAGLEGLFKEVTNWMIALYRDLTGSDLDLTVSKEVKDVFDKIMTRGPGFDNVAPKALGGAQLLRQAAPAPGTPGITDVPPGNVGLGKPGGIPDEARNIERISSSTQAAQYLRGVVQAERATMVDTPMKLEDVAAQAKTVSEDLAKYIPGVDPLDLQRNLSTSKTSAWQLRDASIELQAMRKYESSGGQRLYELAAKGSSASPKEIYEFLMGETAIKTISHQIKQRSREIARALVSMKIVPVPDKTFSFLPPLAPSAAPTPGSVVPPAAAAAPSPAAAMPTPGAAAPAPGALAPSPAAAVPSPAALAPTPGVITQGMDQATQDQIIRQVIDQAGGEEAVRGRMARYTAAHRAAGAEGVLRLSGGSRGIRPALTEYWMNSILSGPITHMVNMTSNMLTALYLPAERALGATVRSDWKTAGNAMREYIYLFQEFGDSLRLAKSSLMMDDNILTKAGTAERDMVGRAISAEGLGLTEGTMGATAANWIGKVLNIPTRMLAAEDEFFKQLTYRANFKTELYIEGMSRFSGDSRAAAQWAETTFEKTLVDGQAYAESVIAKRAASEADRAITEGTLTAAEKGDFIARYMSNEDNWDPSLGVLSQRALDRTNYATFSTKLDPNSPKAVLRLGASVQNLVNKNPVMRFILPFVRTPANILSFTLDRSLLSASPSNLKTALGEYRSLLTHPDAAVRADAAGRFAFAAGTASTVGLLAATGVITGGGPKNKAERELKVQSGWQPYSIRVGDTYYSYRRLDPFSSMLGLVADVVEGYQYADQRSIPLLDAAMNASILSIARNLTNKSYLTGITNVSNALSNPEQFGQMLANQYVSSMLPFSSALSQSVFSVSGDPVARDVRTMLDAVRAKIPYIAEGVAPKRNILGEVIETPNRGVRGLALLNPVSYTDVTDDKILQEFDLLGHGFTPPKEQRGALDLTTFQTTGGQQAYDRWLELHGQVKIGGKTLRQALTKMIGSRDYQKLSPASTDDYDSPRIRQIRTMISKYREEAYKQLLKEAPELRQASRIDFANKQALRMGRSVQELIDLGNR